MAKRRKRETLKENRKLRECVRENTEAKRERRGVCGDKVGKRAVEATK